MDTTTPRDPLRILSLRLSSTPPAQLPAATPTLTPILLACTHTLQAPDSHSTSLHQFRTQLNSLLGSKSPQARYAAAILTKTTLDIGGRETLQKSPSWLRSLLAILGKPDPAVTKKICIVALTKAFLLTQEYPSLIREVTTPLLNPFITACLRLVAPETPFTKAAQIKAQQELLPTVLQSVARLLPNHTTVFRTFTTPLLALAGRIAVSPSAPKDAVVAAQRIWALLPQCAAKQGAESEWAKLVDSCIQETHQTADLVFRAVVEEWQSVAGVIAQPHAPHSYAVSLGVPESKTAAGLPGWEGIHEGCFRLTSLLGLLRAAVETDMASAVVVVPVGKIVDLLARTLQLIPSTNKPKPQGLRLVDQIDRDERDALFIHLPSIQTAALGVVASLLASSGKHLLPVCPIILDNLVYIFSKQRDTSLQSAAYDTLSLLLEITGPTLDKDSIKSIDAIIKSAAHTLLPAAPRESITADSFLAPSQPHKPTRPAPLKQSSPAAAASHVLATYLATTPSSLHPSSTRTLVDRVAVLAQCEAMMIASVLNPPFSASGKSKSSILPHLARAFSERVSVEGLLRPRMPVVFGGAAASEGLDDFAADEEEEEDVDMANVEHLDDDDDDDDAPPVVARVPAFLATKGPEVLADDDDDDDSANVQSRKRGLAEAGEMLAGKRPRIGSEQGDVEVEEKQEEQQQQDDGKGGLIVQGQDVPLVRQLPDESVVVDRTGAIDADGNAPADGVERKGGDDDDESDFEVPALTLEQDTDEDD